jgi:uncharacterized protein with von Willebrand factor type A (vWA) domain
MFKITDDNYEQYKQIDRILWGFQAKALGIDPNVEYSPVKVLEEWEKKSKSLAKQGLKEGLRDSLMNIMESSTAVKQKINDELLKNGLPNLNSLFSIIKSIPNKVLKRGRIKDMDEYYIIKEIIVDLTYDIPEADRTELEKLFWDFENG